MSRYEYLTIISIVAFQGFSTNLVKIEYPHILTGTATATAWNMQNDEIPTIVRNA